MSAYMRAVLVCAAVTSIASILTPEDRPTSKYIKYISGLISLSVIISPLTSFLKSPITMPEHDMGEISGGEYEYDFNGTVLSNAEKIVAETIKRDMSADFRFTEENTDVKVELTKIASGDIRIKRVIIILTGYGSWYSKDQIREYINEKYDVDAEVEIRYE